MIINTCGMTSFVGTYVTIMKMYSETYDHMIDTSCTIKHTIVLV